MLFLIGFSTRTPSSTSCGSGGGEHGRQNTTEVRQVPPPALDPPGRERRAALTPLQIATASLDMDLG